MIVGVGTAMKQQRRVQFLSLFLILVVLGVGFLILNNNINAMFQKTVKDGEHARIDLAEEQDKKLKLETELSIADTDAYIENQARTRFGYLKPGEIRFIITNPEALYSNTGEAPMLQVIKEGDKP